MRRGDRINTTEFPADYPLVILSIVGDKIAIGSPLWPKGASRPLNPQQITTVNGVIINL